MRLRWKGRGELKTFEQEYLGEAYKREKELTEWIFRGQAERRAESKLLHMICSKDSEEPVLTVAEEGKARDI